MHIAKNVYLSMANKQTTHALLEKLKALYEKKLRLFKLILIWHLINMWMKEMKQETTHANTFNYILTELDSQNLNLDEEVKAVVVVSNLSMSWKLFSTTMTNRSN